MNVIREHEFTEEELIRQKGEEAAQRLYYVYEQVIIALLVVVALAVVWSSIKQAYRAIVWFNHVRGKFARDRMKKFT